MHDIQQWLTTIGWKIPDLVAGFSGGVVNAFLMRSITPREAVGSVVVGALTANYLGDMAQHWFGTWLGATSFVIGLSAMAICQGLIEAVKRWGAPWVKPQRLDRDKGGDHA